MIKLTKRPSHLIIKNKEGIQLLLKDHKGMMIGGIIADVKLRQLTIETLWLKPSHRGNSFGSILLSRCIEHARSKGATEARFGTHMPYLKTLLSNNHFTTYKEHHSNGITYSFYQRMLSEGEPFRFKHTLTVEEAPSSEEIEALLHLSDDEMNHYYQEFKMVPINFDMMYKNQTTTSLHGYQTKEFLYIDSPWLDNPFKPDLPLKQFLKAIEDYLKKQCLSQLLFHVMDQTTCDLLMKKGFELSHGNDGHPFFLHKTYAPQLP